MDREARQHRDGYVRAQASSNNRQSIIELNTDYCVANSKASYHDLDQSPRELVEYVPRDRSVQQNFAVDPPVSYQRIPVEHGDMEPLEQKRYAGPQRIEHMDPVTSTASRRYDQIPQPTYVRN